MARRSAARPGAMSEADYAMISAVLLVLGLGFGAWMLWQEQHDSISGLVMRLFHGEMQVIYVFTDRFEEADRQVLATDPARVRIGQLVRLGREIGGFFLVPAVGLVLGLGFACFRGAASARFKRALDLDALMREQASFFRGPAAFTGRRLGLVSISAGAPRPADPALGVEEWVARFATSNSGGFDEASARAELVRQLGLLWLGLEQASPAVRCMLAALALHHAGRRAEALGFLGSLSQSLGAGRAEAPEGPEHPLSFPQALVAEADAVVAEPWLAGVLLAVMAKHAFTAPAMMSALLAARRQAGVLPPAEFAFLKLVDRGLWYALHSLGYALEGEGAHPHPNPRIEAAGAREHWEAEIIAGEPMFLPQIDRAIAAIYAAGTDESSGRTAEAEFQATEPA